MVRIIQNKGNFVVAFAQSTPQSNAKYDNFFLFFKENERIKQKEYVKTALYFRGVCEMA